MRNLLRLSIGVSLTLTASCLIADDTDPDALDRRAPPVKVKVCHLPPGNPGNAHTIEVSDAALPAHLAHGDHVGQCECPPGEEWVCYSGPAETDMVGACMRGVKTCAADGMSYGACVGEVTPVAEVCGDGEDNDCDGTVDDGCVACAAEVCGDGEDNDCDGVVDNGCVVCTPEVCGDGLDNDCDGAVDDGCVVCTAEACGDGVDNDCDGQADEGCIGDRAWRDLNRDGLQNAGEPGVSGATFLLRSASTGGLVAVVVSDAAGTYWFSSIPAGSFYIEVIAPFGLTPTLLDAGPDDVDSDVDFESMSTAPFTFSGAALPTIDVGFIPTADS